MNQYELSFDKKKAGIYELDKAAKEIGNILGEAVKAAHAQQGITKEEFWRNLFIVTGTGWSGKENRYTNDQPLKDPRYDDPQRCPDDPYREMDLYFWIKYLLEGGCRVVSEEGGNIRYAEDSLSFFDFFGLDCCYKGDYPERRSLSGEYRNILKALKTVRNSYVGHVSSKHIEDASLKTLKGALETLFATLEPMCCKNWAGKKYAIARRESTDILFYRSLQEVPYAISEVLSTVNLEPEHVDMELFTKAGLRTEDDMIYLNCDPVYFANIVKSLMQIEVPEEMWIMQLRRTQERTVDEKALLELSNINEVPLSVKDRAINVAEMTPEELLQKAESGELNAQLALAEYCKSVQKDHASAFHWWNRAAERGNAMAQYQVGLCWLLGKGVARNPEEAVTWLRKAVEQGDAQAQYLLGDCYAEGRGVTKDPVTAVSWLQKSAEQGHGMAQYKMGVCCQNGNGTDKNLSKALKWYRLAAEQGNTAAQIKLALMLEDGTLGDKDLQAAFVWYRKAAEQKSHAAFWHVGRCYAGGIGTESNMKEAVVWYRKAAEWGHADAQHQLGLCYYRGTGIEKDLQNAFSWFQKAAHKGSVPAQFCLAWCYEAGLGTQQDYERAANWYKEAAEQGNASAQNNLGVLYEYAKGVPRSYEKAVYWYQQGANNGCDTAKFHLAGCYQLGNGVPQSIEDAIYWTKKAMESKNAELVKKAQERYERLIRQRAKNG